MHIIPKASKVKVTFYKGITIPDILIAIAALAVVAVTLSSNFAFRVYIAVAVVCLVAPLYVSVGEQRLYVQIAYLFRYAFSKKRFGPDKKAPVSSVIPYREAKNGIVYCKDGSVFGAIEVEPVNFGVLDEAKQDDLIESVYARVLNSVGPDEEWSLIKTEMPLVLDTQMAAELKRADRLTAMEGSGLINGTEYAKRCDVIQSRLGQIDTVNSSGEKHPRFFLALNGVDTNDISDKLEKAVDTFGAGGMRAHRLNDQELLVFIRSGYGSDFDPRDQLRIVNQPDDLKFGLTATSQDGLSVSHLAISRYPLQVPNAWAERLFSLDGTKVTMRMKPIEKSKAVKRIDNAILELETKNVGKESQAMESDSHLDTLRELLADIQQNNETLFDTVLILSVYDEPKSSANRKAAKDTLREMGFGFSELIGRQMDGYVSAMVSTKEMTKMAHGIQTSSLAAAFPFSSDTLIDPDGIYLGDNSMPAFPDFFKRDLTHVNSNMVVIGQSGSGKSYATKTLLANFASAGAKVFVLDPESEYGSLAKNLGGVSIDASDGKKGRINPLQIITSMDDEGGASSSYYAQLQFLEQFFKTVLQGISQDSLEILNKIVEEAYSVKGIRPGRDIAALKNEDFPTLQDVCDIADKKLAESTDTYEQNCLHVLVNYLARFKTGGRDSALWNGYTTFSAKEAFVNFDFQRLLANRNDATANAQMLLLLRWLENEVIRNRDYNALRHADRKVVVAIDEAHLFIDEKYPIALDFMYQLAKRIRKYDGMLVIITQNVRDFAGTPEIARKSTAIINVSQYSMIFALSPNDMTELMALYENSGGINPSERDAIVHSPRGTCFLISSPSERGILSIQANKETEKLFRESY
jgi:conjugal transfer ATP-binding protein TraC